MVNDVRFWWWCSGPKACAFAKVCVCEIFVRRWVCEVSFSPCDVVSCSSMLVYWSLSTIGVCMVGIEEEEGDAELLVAVGGSGF